MPLEFTADTSTLSYWFNWRVLLCTIWLLASMVIASFIIWKYEGSNLLKSEREETQQDITWFSRDDQTWRPCLKTIHPIWLLAFRVLAFGFLLATLIVKVLLNGGVIFYYYTQWTLTLMTLFFGFGSLLSLRGCYQHHKMSSRRDHVGEDTEQGPYLPLTHEDNTNTYSGEKISTSQEEDYLSQEAGLLSRCFQVMFQMNAGAVMLTDAIYWLIIFPFLTLKDYNMSFMTVNTHTLNAALLLGDTCLNSLGFPWFRISYFVLWTSVFVIFQWIIHACVSIGWPYPFLDLSSLYAPLWYLLIGLIHIPCYAFFALIVEIKHYLFSKWFPLSYQCLR